MYRDSRGKPINAGDMVILIDAPLSLLGGLPDDDQQAIKSVVGKELLLVGFDKHKNAELEFADGQGVIHTIWVETKYLQATP